MKRIYKYTIAKADRSSIAMPEDAYVRSVQVQHGDICLWAEVNPNARLVDRSVLVVGTGHDLPSDVDFYAYIGTVQLHGGSLVFHVYIR